MLAMVDSDKGLMLYHFYQFYDELDKVLHDYLSFCPMEGKVLISALRGISSCTDTTPNVTSE